MRNENDLKKNDFQQFLVLSIVLNQIKLNSHDLNSNLINLNETLD